MNYVIKADEMTPKERAEAFSKGERIDRVMCCPFVGESFASYFGHSIRSFNHSTDVMVDTAIKTFEMFGGDGVSIGPGLHGIPEAMGSVMEFPEHGTPLFMSPAIKDYSEIGKLKILNPYKDGRIKLYLDALEITRDKLSNIIPVGNTVSGPFSIAAFLVGTEKLLKDLRKNPEGAHQILEIATQSTLNFIDAVLKLGIKPGIADPIASSTMISPKTYKEFVYPYSKRCMDRIIEKTGSGSCMHICGKSKPIWGDMVATGISALSLDNCEDIGELKDLHGDKVSLVGNVDPVKILYNGGRKEIYEASRICIEKARGSKNGFILASGCDIAIGTDPQNIHDFIDAARIFGRDM